MNPPWVSGQLTPKARLHDPMQVGWLCNPPSVGPMLWVSIVLWTMITRASDGHRHSLVSSSTSLCAKVLMHWTSVQHSLGIPYSLVDVILLAKIGLIADMSQLWMWRHTVHFGCHHHHQCTYAAIILMPGFDRFVIQYIWSTWLIAVGSQQFIVYYACDLLIFIHPSLPKFVYSIHDHSNIIDPHYRMYGHLLLLKVWSPIALIWYLTYPMNKYIIHVSI